MSQTETVTMPKTNDVNDRWEIPLAVATVLLLAGVAHGCAWLLGETYGPWRRWSDLPQLLCLIPLVLLLVGTIASRTPHREPWVLPVARAVWGSALFHGVILAGMSVLFLLFQTFLAIRHETESGVVVVAYLIAILAGLCAVFGGMILGFQDEIGSAAHALPLRAQLVRVLEDALERARRPPHGSDVGRPNSS